MKLETDDCLCPDESGNNRFNHASLICQLPLEQVRHLASWALHFALCEFPADKFDGLDAKRWQQLILGALPEQFRKVMSAAIEKYGK